MTNPESAAAPKLGFPTRIAYGVGGAAGGIKNNGFDYVLLLFYSQILGLPGLWVAAAIWIADHGFLAPGWPVIKRVRGLPGDEICRENETVSINGETVATALETDSNGLGLPSWSGCFTLQEGEVFLLNDHPQSLDGRYFGATQMKDVRGSARLLFSISD